MLFWILLLATPLIVLFLPMIAIMLTRFEQRHRFPSREIVIVAGISLLLAIVVCIKYLLQALPRG